MVFLEEIDKKELMRVFYVIKEVNKWKVLIYCKRIYGFNIYVLRYVLILYLF